MNEQIDGILTLKKKNKVRTINRKYPLSLIILMDPHYLVFLEFAFIS